MQKGGDQTGGSVSENGRHMYVECLGCLTEQQDGPDEGLFPLVGCKLEGKLIKA